MVTHSSILAWRIPWTQKPGGLQSIGSPRVGHNWSDSAINNLPAVQETLERGVDPWVRKTPWRRAWQPTPVFLPGESPGQCNLGGYSSEGSKESDMTEVTEHNT